MKNRINFLVNLVRSIFVIAGVVMLAVGLSMKIQPLWIVGAVMLGLVVLVSIISEVAKGYKKAKLSDMAEKQNNTQPSNNNDKNKQ